MPPPPFQPTMGCILSLVKIDGKWLQDSLFLGEQRATKHAEENRHLFLLHYILLLLEQINMTSMASHNTNVLLYISEGQKSRWTKITEWVGLYSFWRFQGRESDTMLLRTRYPHISGFMTPSFLPPAPLSIVLPPFWLCPSCIPYYKNPCNCIGLTQIIQDTLLTSNFLT